MTLASHLLLWTINQSQNIYWKLGTTMSSGSIIHQFDLVSHEFTNFSGTRKEVVTSAVYIHIQSLTLLRYQYWNEIQRIPITVTHIN